MIETPLNRSDVPDVVWMSDNEFGVPLLDLNMQADLPDAPILPWGSVPRKGKMFGTYHFFADDYKFRALDTDPSPLVNSGCRNIVEPNFSTSDCMPLYEAIYRTGRKRWIARWCQFHGIRVFVDLNVAPAHRKTNMLGVPRGWRSYATRALASDLDEVCWDFEMARIHAETDNILFLVYGGGKKAHDLCLKHGWWHVPERADIVRGRYTNG